MFKTKNGAFFSSPLPLPPLLNANVHFGRVFFESHLVLDQTQGFGAVFS
jgi:hypothetical protein